MKKISLLALGGLFALALHGNAVTFTENFTNNPAQNGWQIFGDTNLFQWDSTNDVMDVTWDSSQENSYFYHPLGVTLTRGENFTIAFDMQLNEAEAGGYGFQLAIGLLNFSEATNANFIRGTSYNSPDLVELDYFPDVGYGPTTWPVFADCNSTFNFNSASDYAVYAPNLDDWYHIVMTYTASNQTMVTTMTNFEQTSGITVVDPIMPYSPTNAVNFADYQVDTFSVSSYSGEDSGGSIYAQGALSNIVVCAQNPPAASNSAVTFTENFTNDPALNGWQVFGNTNLFQWTNDVMDVTWDSSQTNSYFYHPLGTTLIQADSFSLSFDIQLNSITYSNFPVLAVGLFNYCDATNSNFSRPYATTPNIFEFDYYPDSGDQFDDPNVAASMTDDTGGLTNDPDFYFIFDDLPMNTNTTYHVTLTHAAWEQGLTATMSVGGQIYTTMPLAYTQPMADFRLDTVSINSYQDTNNPLLAQGTVGNFVVTMPPPERNLEFAFTSGVAQVRFGTYTNWTYMLERSTNLFTWSEISPCVSGSGQPLTFSDTSAPATQAFYRVKAIQP